MDAWKQRHMWKPMFCGALNLKSSLETCNPSFGVFELGIILLEPFTFKPFTTWNDLSSLLGTSNLLLWNLYIHRSLHLYVQPSKLFAWRSMTRPKSQFKTPKTLSAQNTTHDAQVCAPQEHLPRHQRSRPQQSTHSLVLEFQRSGSKNRATDWVCVSKRGIWTWKETTKMITCLPFCLFQMLFSCQSLFETFAPFLWKIQSHWEAPTMLFSPAHRCQTKISGCKTHEDATGHPKHVWEYVS